MASHKKNQLFIRIVTNEKLVVCINPAHLASFQIAAKAKIKIKSKDAAVKEPEIIEADTIRFYFATGTGLTYSVGIDISEDEFNYICDTLREYVYLNEAEFVAKSAAIDKEKMDGWNKLSAENEEKVVTTTTTTGSNNTKR